MLEKGSRIIKEGKKTLLEKKALVNPPTKWDNKTLKREL